MGTSKVFADYVCDQLIAKVNTPKASMQAVTDIVATLTVLTAVVEFDMHELDKGSDNSDAVFSVAIP